MKTMRFYSSNSNALNYIMEEKLKEKYIHMEETNKKAGGFSGFILLEEERWDKEQFKIDFAKDWDLEPIYEEGESTKEGDSDTDVVIMELNEQRVIFGYMGIPVPDGEAEDNAAYNYMWKDAVEVTKKHKAHMVVMIVGKHNDIMEDGELFVKVVSTLCKQENVIGVYTNGVVYEPKFYFAMKECLRAGIFPIMGLVWFHMIREECGFSIYTIGMKNFGKDEMEIIKVEENPVEVRDFLMEIASYVILEDVTLCHGETIGLTEEHICKIIRSQGVYVGDMSLKIDYHK